MENLIVSLEINYSEKLVLCSSDTAATYKLSDISVDYIGKFDERYAAMIGELYAGTALIPYSQVKSIHCQALLKKHTNWKTDINNLSAHSLQG